MEDYMSTLRREALEAVRDCTQAVKEADTEHKAEMMQALAALIATSAQLERTTFQV